MKNHFRCNRMKNQNINSQKQKVLSRQRINAGTKKGLKHNDSGDNEWVDADFENEAALLFVKAMKNYFNSYNEFPKDRTLRGLFEELTL